MKFVVGKAGINAETATNPNDFIFHSDYNTFQIVLEGSLTSQSVDADPKTFSVAHGLSYIPVVMAFAKFPDGYVGMNMIGQKTSGLFYQRRFYVEVDATNVYFVFYQGVSGTYSVDIKYYIFESDVA